MNAIMQLALFTNMTDERMFTVSWQEKEHSHDYYMRKCSNATLSENVFQYTISHYAGAVAAISFCCQKTQGGSGFQEKNP